MVIRLASDIRRTAVSAAFACVAASIGIDAQATPSPEKPAGTMNDLREHFATCFQPPNDAAGTRVTFYFSLNNKGQVIAQPRTTWIGFKGNEDERMRGLAEFERGFDKCLPLSMSQQLAATIPGKVYFLQYIVADKGGDSQVLLRPFGSHYYGGGAPALGFEPLLPRQGFAPTVPRAPLAPSRRLPLMRPFRPFVGPLPLLLRLHRARVRAMSAPHPVR